jgi:hypothetical protein
MCRSPLIMIATLGVALVLTVSASAAQPRLRPLAGASVITGSLRSDAIRYVDFTNATGQNIVLDSQTGRRAVLAARKCESPGSSPAIAGQPPDEYQTIGLSTGELILACSDLHSLLTVSLATDTVAHEASYVPVTSTNGPPATGGSQWVRFPSCEYAGSGNISCEDEQLFNVATGAAYPGRIGPSPTTYADLSSPALIQHLCMPVRLTDARLPGMGSYEQVEAVERPWVLVRQSRGAPGRRGGEYLLAWRCGQRRPVELGQLSGRAQLGAGLVSWEGPRGAINVENLATFVRWSWRRAGAGASEYPVVHTSRTLFAEGAFAGSARAVLTASLDHLSVRTYQEGPPATVARPEGVATPGP